jgi:hypothetical protein
MKDLLMVNYRNFKSIILAILALVITISGAKSQTTYQKYDATTRSTEYHIAKSQIESNKRYMKLLQEQKETLSLSRDSKTRSRIQGVISAKENENFRLGQKAFLVMDANSVEDPQKLNEMYNKLKPTAERIR